MRGYSLSVGSGNGATDLVPGGVAGFERLRVMVEPRLGPLHFDVAYEHGLEIRDGEQRLTSPLGAPTATTWLDLQWTLVDEPRTTWSHRFDRLAVSARGAAWEVQVGRQAISWATTLILTLRNQ